MRNWIIKLLGGYPNIDSLLEVVHCHEDKHKILTQAVKHSFNTIGDDDILREVNGKLVVAGRPITEARAKAVIAEAEIFLNSYLWRVLQDDIKYNSNKISFIKSQTEFDMIAGKTWLFALDAIKTRLKGLKDTATRLRK